MNSHLNNTIEINGRSVSVEWTKAAARELTRRTQPLVVELELYFSCLVKKFVHFHETPPQRDTIAVSDKLAVFFRPVTSTACSFEVADAVITALNTSAKPSKTGRQNSRYAWISFSLATRNRMRTSNVITVRCAMTG